MLNTVQQMQREDGPFNNPLAHSASDVAGLLDGSRDINTLVPAVGEHVMAPSGSLEAVIEADERGDVHHAAGADQVAANWEGADARFQAASAQLASIPDETAVQTTVQASVAAVSSSMRALRVSSADRHAEASSTAPAADSDDCKASQPAAPVAGLVDLTCESAAESPTAQNAQTGEAEDSACPLPTKAVSPDAKVMSSGFAQSDRDSHSVAVGDNAAASRGSGVGGASTTRAEAIAASTQQILQTQNGAEGGNRAAEDKDNVQQQSAAVRASGGSVTRSFEEQQQVPAVDWTAVRGALQREMPSDVAKLLQVCWPDHLDCNVVHFSWSFCSAQAVARVLCIAHLLQCGICKQSCCFAGGTLALDQIAARRRIQAA